MASNLISNLENLEAKIGKLAAKVKELETRNAYLENQNKELVRKADEAEKSRAKAEQEAEFMAVSHRLADNPDTLADTRRHIAGLIRNIDRCLEMLKE